MAKKEKGGDNITDLHLQIQDLKKTIAAKNSLDDVPTTTGVTGNRLLEEQRDDDLRIMNYKYAFVKSVGTKPMVLTRMYNEFYKKDVNELITPDSMLIREANYAVEGPKGGLIPRGKWWLGHKHRKEYETLTFEPDKPSGEYQGAHSKMYFNTWEGFAIEPKKGDWGYTKRHIYWILCNGDPEKFKYVIRWFAYLVQYPERHAEVALVFKGRKGAGKSFIFEQFHRIFGIHSLIVSSREHLTGKHNDHLQDKSFLFADEAYYPGDKEAEGVLKSIITSKSLTTEPKFRGVRQGNNCLHIGMATNSDWVIPASEDERRYFINTVEPTYTKGKATPNEIVKYFKRLWGEMEGDGLAAMLYDLLHIDITGWHPRSNIPVTEELKNQIMLSLPAHKRIMLQMLEEGVFPGTINSKGEYVISNNNLIKHFQNQDTKLKNMNHKVMSQLCRELNLNTHRTGTMGRYYIFPELKELRDRWEELTSGSMPWDLEEKWVVQSKDYGI